MTETPFVLRCAGQRLCAILHEPDVPQARGVVMLVGGPQYRIGSHRQFVLTARALAADGMSVLRFDQRGVGDSEGESRSFEDIAEDLDCAIAELLRRAPTVSEVVVWGLCDAASAAALFAHRNPAVSGIVMLNPWVRDDTTMARTYLRHYYPHRLVSPSLWGKVLGGRFEFRRSLKAFFETAIAAAKRSGSRGNTRSTYSLDALNNKPLQKRMVQGLQRFNGRLLIILSGQDLTAKEFSDVSSEMGDWRSLLAEDRVTQHTLPEADHTFRARSDMDKVAKYSSDWIRAS